MNEKKSLSCSRASSQVIPSLKSLVAGCFTANHPFTRCSASSLMSRNQLSSSPRGIRSGLVRTPARGQVAEAVWGTSLRTNGPLSIRIVLFHHVMGTLVFEVGCVVKLTTRKSITRPQNLLSQLTVRRIRQLGLEMYVVMRSLTKSMSDEFPPWLTLTINPVRMKLTFK